MGEIGIKREEFLYEMKLWEIQAVIRGYRRRIRPDWELTRWQTYMLMCVSMADMKKAGIYRPTDLIKFPWEKEHVNTDLPSEEEIEEMRREMRMFNEQMQREREEKQSTDSNNEETREDE